MKNKVPNYVALITLILESPPIEIMPLQPSHFLNIAVL